MAKAYKLGFWRRLVNRIVAWTARRGWGGQWLLTTRGRHSGRLRTTPVTPIGVGGEKYLVSPYGNVSWVHNARDSKRVTLNRGAITEQHTVVEVEPAEAAPVLAAYVRKLKAVRPFFDATVGSSLEDFEAEAARHPVFRLDPVF